jgi:hypothetical protein
MAAGEQTGADAQELAEMRFKYQGTPKHEAGIPFETAYCIESIGKQPDEYDGPQRYCRKRVKRYTDDNGKERHAPSCRFHGGRKGGNADRLDEPGLANLSHGYYAMEEHLLEDLSDKERRAYEKIMERGAENGITKDDDFFSWESLQSLALNIVTDRRLRKVINNEGVVKEVNEFSAQGELLDKNDEEHHLLSISQSQRRLIEKLKENLGLTRKHKDEMDAIEEGGTIEFLSEGMESALEDGDDYDPEDWDDEESG